MSKLLQRCPMTDQVCLKALNSVMEETKVALGSFVLFAA